MTSTLPSYIKTSQPCEVSRQVQLNNIRAYFSAESIPLCQVTQPRRENIPTKDVISIVTPQFCVNDKIRYTRSSFKKQKTINQEDYNGVFDPMGEHENTLKLLSNRVQEIETDPNRKQLKQCKMAELKRKTFLRKISLQDNHLNYNQDYWLDLRKSKSFHTNRNGLVETDFDVFNEEEKNFQIKEEENKKKSDINLNGITNIGDFTQPLYDFNDFCEVKL
ncbi:hypothetical protein Phum_PHUM466670 [Pediculus humanus corporis]|uniref:Uncharacterized protein n=1 Tax=Pediculus humanus subsp. corporis TaxID=121224 RepID=E0VVQ5_PEDHC|nr:uncharacterized protein Phum_PHUM466670 [Pediculus humanus corporis]EEB17461.1 hypothetical protein Phum_PHUM466670 [Pediculus humanus corporis]